MVTQIPRKEHFSSHLKVASMNICSKKLKSFPQEEVQNADWLLPGNSRVNWAVSSNPEIVFWSMLTQAWEDLSKEQRTAEKPSILRDLKLPKCVHGPEEKTQPFTRHDLKKKQQKYLSNDLPCHIYHRVKILIYVSTRFLFIHKNIYACLLDETHPLISIITS